MRRQATPMITSIENFIEMLRADSTSWNPMEPKWFRGEPRGLTPLLPTLYREGLAAFENPLLQMFRSRASGYHDVVPDVERTDQWLFLARHAGVPTRLLDWTEGALIGLHFALQENEKEPVVWMLNPLEMNRLSTPSDPAMLPDPNRIREFPLPWHDPDPDPPRGFLEFALEPQLIRHSKTSVGLGSKINTEGTSLSLYIQHMCIPACVPSARVSPYMESGRKGSTRWSPTRFLSVTTSTQPVANRY
jgi:hypothetical protein